MEKDISELLNTTVTMRDLHHAVADEQGVLYSEDGLFLLQCHNRELHSYTVKEGCRIICDHAFFDAAPFACELEEIIVPEGIWAIGDSAFLACGKLRKVDLPESLRYIGPGAFEMCLSLKSLTLPGGLRAMGGNPLADSVVEDIVSHSPHFRFVDGCLMQDDMMVAYLRDSTECHVPLGTKKLGNRLFHQKNHVREIVLPEGLEEIGDNAFQNCTLQELAIPASVRRIGENPFDHDAVKRLRLMSPYFTFDNGLLVSDKGVLISYLGEDADVVIPETVTEVGPYAFSKNRNLRSVTLPSRLKAIRHHAFSLCKQLSSLTIPESVKRIDRYAFEGCSGIRQLQLPTGLSIVDDGLFSLSGIEELAIPEGVTYIGKDAFFFCRHLRAVTIPASVTTIDDRAFMACEKLGQIEVPNKSARRGTHAFSTNPQDLFS